MIHCPIPKSSECSSLDHLKFFKCSQEELKAENPPGKAHRHLEPYNYAYDFKCRWPTEPYASYLQPRLGGFLDPEAKAERVGKETLWLYQRWKGSASYSSEIIQSTSAQKSVSFESASACLSLCFAAFTTSLLLTCLATSTSWDAIVASITSTGTVK